MTYPRRETPEDTVWLPRAARAAAASGSVPLSDDGLPAPPGPETPVRSRRGYRGIRRKENGWSSYALIIAVPLALVLVIVIFSALPPYTPSSRAATGPGGNAASAARPPSPTVDAVTAGQPCVVAQPPSIAARPTSTPAAGTVTTYEAEDRTNNKLGPKITFCSLSAASGGFTISGVGSGSPGGDVQFNGVTVADGGQHTVTIYFVSATGTGARRKLLMKVNGKSLPLLTFPPTQDWQHVGFITVKATLNAGANTILFINALKAGPNLDRLTVK
ncbi:MAG: hypothetical protein J2P15_04725 [Micromonosporaceae bacterium]|nr:hypothetical protein [Micromonosporaceae bacterium]